MNLEPHWTAWLPALALAATCIAITLRAGPPWGIARVGAGVAVGLAALHAALGLTGHHGADFGAADVFTLLVAFLGWIVLRFSARYVAGEPGEARYAKALTATLAAVAGLAAADHLGVMLALWIAASVGLHSLLLFYPERPAARLAAHKKFIASRLAEGLFGVALVLVYREAGTLHIDALSAYAAGRDSLPLGMHVAMLLIAVAAVSKCAQVPVHGWLIQVMEAPTPVSALLHAGIVNVAGFVLIRLGDLLALAPAAQAVLVVVGGLSALLAGLVMLTRVSIKVRLAWSTCAQMGFMLVECGLGLYELALLHLVAHSLYKAHAFLTAGETVTRIRQRDLWPAAGRPDVALGRALLSAPVALALTAGTLVAWQAVGADPVPWVAVVVVALGLAPMLWYSAPGGAVRIVGLASLYALWHAGFATLTPQRVPPPVGLELFAATCLVATYFLQYWLVHRASSPLARSLYPWAYAGFYADERFTRWALAVWPPAAAGAHLPQAQPRRLEEPR
jgi:NAD(P)H-quinone oxidoreductase subunit 5